MITGSIVTGNNHASKPCVMASSVNSCGSYNIGVNQLSRLLLWVSWIKFHACLKLQMN